MPTVEVEQKSKPEGTLHPFKFVGDNGDEMTIRKFEFVRVIGAFVEVGGKEEIIYAAIKTAVEAAGHKRTDRFTPEGAKAITNALCRDLPGVVIVREFQGKFGGTRMSKNSLDGSCAHIAIDDDDQKDRYILSFPIAPKGGAIGNRLVTSLAASVKGMEALGLGKGSPIAFSAFPFKETNAQGAEIKDAQGNPYWVFSSMIKTPGPDGSFGRNSGESVVPTNGFWPDLKPLRQEMTAVFKKVGLTGNDLTGALRQQETQKLIPFYETALQKHNMWAGNAISLRDPDNKTVPGGFRSPTPATDKPQAPSAPAAPV